MLVEILLQLVICRNVMDESKDTAQTKFSEVCLTVLYKLLMSSFVSNSNLGGFATIEQGESRGVAFTTGYHHGHCRLDTMKVRFSSRVAIIEVYSFVYSTDCFKSLFPHSFPPH